MLPPDISLVKNSWSLHKTLPERHLVMVPGNDSEGINQLVGVLTFGDEEEGIEVDLIARSAHWRPEDTGSWPDDPTYRQEARDKQLAKDMEGLQLDVGEQAKNARLAQLTRLPGDESRRVSSADTDRRELLWTRTPTQSILTHMVRVRHAGKEHDIIKSITSFIWLEHASDSKVVVRQYDNPKFDLAVCDRVTTELHQKLCGVPSLRTSKLVNLR